MAAVSCAFPRNPVALVNRFSSSANPSHIATGFYVWLGFERGGLIREKLLKDFVISKMMVPIVATLIRAFVIH